MTNPGDIPEIDPKQYPAEVHTMLLEANQAESAGDFFGAESHFRDALETLRNCGCREGESLRLLNLRAELNRRLSVDLRTAYKGTAESSLIQVFDEENRYTCSRPKDEVHRAPGLFHRTAILLLVCNRQVVFYERKHPQSSPGSLDFFGGHTADGDASPFDTARREANEELRLYVNGIRLSFPDEWFHLVGAEHEFVWNAPRNREKSTLFVVEMPNHRGIVLEICDDSADGQSIVSGQKFETEFLSILVDDYQQGRRKFADGAERILIAITRSHRLRAELGRWFPDIRQLRAASDDSAR